MSNSSNFCWPWRYFTLRSSISYLACFETTCCDTYWILLDCFVILLFTAQTFPSKLGQNSASHWRDDFINYCFDTGQESTFSCTWYRPRIHNPRNPHYQNNWYPRDTIRNNALYIKDTPRVQDQNVWQDQDVWQRPRPLTRPWQIIWKQQDNMMFITNSSLDGGLSW